MSFTRLDFEESPTTRHQELNHEVNAIANDPVDRRQLSSPLKHFKDSNSRRSRRGDNASSIVRYSYSTALQWLCAQQETNGHCFVTPKEQQ